jgi:phosphate transport system protein
MELVSELERIGDYAADVARILKRSGGLPFPSETVAAIVEIARDAIGMLTDSLDAFTQGQDARTALASIAREDQVDRNEEAVIERVLEMMSTNPGFAAGGTYLLWIVHNYERVADRATNVAERAVYVASGETRDLD